jgi:hypothetical protein
MVSSVRRTILATCAMAMALGAFGACSDDGKPTKVLGEVIERSAASASPSTTAGPSIPSTTTAPSTTTTAPAPSTTAAPTPTTAAPRATQPPATSPPDTEPPPTEATLPPPVIQVVYQVPEGSTATAAIDGPSGHIEKPIDSGSARFEDLAEGVYEIVVTVVTQPPPTDGSGSTIGPANSESRVRVEVHNGDTATMTCSGYADCNGTA